jgi:predicted GNAT family acetyltransferase
VNTHLYPAPEAFGAVIRAVYLADPVSFTMELTALREQDWPRGQILLSVDNGDGVVGAAVEGRGGALLVSGIPPELADVVASALSANATVLTGVRGIRLAAEAFAHKWSEATRAHVAVEREEALYLVDELTPPVGVPGRCRPHDDGDTEILVEWLGEFVAEAFGQASGEVVDRALLRRVDASDDRILLWTVDGEPVSMARLHAPAAGVSRIGPVYTPPEHRGHGYAAAVTSDGVVRAREGGAHSVVLFADLANPLSNRVYRRIGFRAVSEHLHYGVSSP